MVKFIAALIALANLLSPISFGGGSSSPALPEAEHLRQIQQQYIEDQGTDLEELATRMQAHLGLPATAIDSVPGRCDLAMMENGATDSHTLPADPEAALDSLVDDLRTHGPAEVQATLSFMDDRGNRIEWQPQELEGTNYLAIQTSKRLMVGAQWLATALEDPASVHGNIQHELGGHLYYGDTLSCRIVDAAVGDNDSVDHMDLFWKFGYAESEIYAELKELPHAIDGGLGDHPVTDVADQVAHMRTVFPTDIAELLLDSMAHRFAADTTLTAEALQLFADTIG